MQYFLIIVMLLFPGLSSGQQRLPYFLQGTWKTEGREQYEHWDKLNDQNLKGCSYQLREGQMMVTEYLDIAYSPAEVLYTATVIGQNKGKGIHFKMTCTDSTFVFENPGHDFPKKIVYRQLSDTAVLVQVSDGGQKKFSYTMTRLRVAETLPVAGVDNPDYDPVLAGKLGADAYGMKAYFFVILKTGPGSTADKALASESFKGHLDNISRLVKEGKLVVAGPLEKNGLQYRGIFVLNNVTSAEEAEALLLTDPAISNRLLDYELFKWYGSAALPEYLPVSDKIWKLKP